MPVIDWIGKKEVLGAVRGAVRLLRGVCGLSAGDDEAGNLLVQGDNLEALRTLLPHYGGRVKCVYIDPPYNTGNEGWKYNDRTDSPQIRRWLGKVVGDEASDLCRHDKWLCMMYPRLRLLKEFLREDGVIFVSIDDNEQHRLRMLMDEIFGASNFINLVAVVANLKGNNSDKFFSGIHEYGLVYAKNKSESISFNHFAAHDDWENWEEDEEGYWKKGGILSATQGKTGENSKTNFPVYVSEKDEVSLVRQNETDTELRPFSKGKATRWYWSKETFAQMKDEVLVVRGKDGISLYGKQRMGIDDIPQAIPKSVLYRPNYGQGGADLEKVMGKINAFPNPKSVSFVKDILHMFTDKDSIVMDSFAGSGTTAHAVLQLNEKDKGDRKFILVEMEEDIARDITAKRLKKVIMGYKSNGKNVAPLGDGFRFCTLGPPLFDDNGHINKEVRFADLAAHIFFSETGMPIPKRATTPLLGICEGRAIYLLYNGIMGDTSRDGGNMLTPEILSDLPKPPRGATRVIFAEGKLSMSNRRLARERIDFRQIPYKIRMR